MHLVLFAGIINYVSPSSIMDTVEMGGSSK